MRWCTEVGGERGSANEFADAIYWTLQQGSFEAFEWKYGPRPIRYDDWFYAKLLRFSEILIYEKLLIGHRYPPETEEPWKESFLTGRGPVPSEPD